MRVLIVNTSERKGGAAVAAYRLVEALNNNGVKAKMLVSDKETDSITVVELGRKWLSRWHFLWERWTIFFHLHFSRTHLFHVDIANSGTDITRLPEFKEADVIHLHWINQGMLSLGSIRKILRSGKPVVWTMHDMWPATAICHLTLGCARFKSGCRHCKYLPGNGSDNDLAVRTWRKKTNMLKGQHVAFVACSKWLAGEARGSLLLEGQSVKAIPNPIDTHVFCPKSKREARIRLNLPQDMQLILFAAQRVNNANKGVEFLQNACNKLMDEHPEQNGKLGILSMGRHAESIGEDLQMPVFSMGYVADVQTLVDIYNAADVFVLPSLSENLPNTIMEAMACGVPCVGFKVGGIPEMIDHCQTGYVASYRNTDDLKDGIWWTLQADGDELSKASVRKVAQNYSQTSVASRYYEVYHEILTMKHLKL
ncbi:MAG: glycosyltransferase family 4 protein [Prevotella sp.]|nr:glycosyltransferase family 4 protein [Prevotella sp.]